MKKLKYKNMLVILFSALFLSTGNLTYSISLFSCETAECCEAECCEVDCCEEPESAENSADDSALCEDENCCEYNQNNKNDLKTSPAVFSGQNSHVSIASKPAYSYFVNCFTKHNLQESSAKQYPVHPSISILRI